MRTNRWFNRRRAASVLVACMLVWGAAPPPAAAQCESAKLLASDGAVGDQFGTSVSISGDVAVVGAVRDDAPLSNSGSAYIFRFTGLSWVQEAKLTASDGAADDQFGTSVSISGDVIVVGAFFDDDNGRFSGSAYVFQEPPGGWVTMTETAKLTASDGAAGDLFGFSVSVSGDVAVVGAQLHDDNGTASGSAYVSVGLLGLDCNGNGQPDACDIFLGVSCDSNANGIPDDCELAASGPDITGPGGVPDGCVDAFDLGALLASWCSVAGGNPCGTCFP